MGFDKRQSLLFRYSCLVLVIIATWGNLHKSHKNKPCYMNNQFFQFLKSTHIHDTLWALPSLVSPIQFQRSEVKFLFKSSSFEYETIKLSVAWHTIWHPRMINHLIFIYHDTLKLRNVTECCLFWSCYTWISGNIHFKIQNVIQLTWNHMYSMPILWVKLPAPFNGTINHGCMTHLWHTFHRVKTVSSNWRLQNLVFHPPSHE